MLPEQDGINSVQVKVLQSEVIDAHFENIERKIIKAIEETGRWY